MNERDKDRLAEEYLLALDEANFSTIDRLWKLAEVDPELEEFLHELNVERDLEFERQAQLLARRPIAQAAVEHLKSGQIIEEAGRPLTVGDVAREILREASGLPAEAHLLNGKLERSMEPIPLTLGLTKLIAWAEQQWGPASLDYWKAFQKAALKLKRRQSSLVEYQLAARRAAKPGGRK